MSSVVAETIDILGRKSPISFQEVWVDDLVIGIFFISIDSLLHG
jgi:hypothetical protein